MYFLGSFYLNGSILTIVTVNALAECPAYFTGIYQSRHTGVAVVELNQYRFINIVVNQNNPLGRTLDKTAYKLVRIEYLTVEENALFGRQRCADEEINLVCQIIKSFIMLEQSAVDAALHL